MGLYFIDSEDVKTIEGLITRVKKELRVLYERPIGTHNRNTIDNVMDDVNIIEDIVEGIKDR